MTNQSKLLTKHKIPIFVVCFRAYLGLTLVNRNQWVKNIFLSQYIFIAISFYRNIVRQNVSCDVGLMLHDFFRNHLPSLTIKNVLPNVPGIMSHTLNCSSAYVHSFTLTLSNSHELARAFFISYTVCQGLWPL